MTVLFIDDEERRMRPVREEFEDAGHTVTFITNIDEALPVIRDVTQKFDLIVMDISMPTGKELDRAATDGGARSGILLYEILRETRPTQKVAVYTNYGAKMEGKFPADRRFLRFVPKQDFLAYEFVGQMEAFVSQQSDERFLLQ